MRTRSRSTPLAASLLFAGFVAAFFPSCEKPHFDSVSPNFVQAGDQHVQVDFADDQNENGRYSDKTRVIIDGQPGHGVGITLDGTETVIDSDHMYAMLSIASDAPGGAHDITLANPGG